MSRLDHLPYHARTHLAGGSDPIIGLSGGARLFGAGWSGPYPLNILTGAVWKVPLVDGASVTFNLTRLVFRLENPGLGTTTVRVEKSTTTGVFTPTTVETISLAAGAYEATDTTGLGSVTSGNLLRIVWTAVGTNARGYLVFLEGTGA